MGGSTINSDPHLSATGFTGSKSRSADKGSSSSHQVCHLSGRLVGLVLLHASCLGPVRLLSACPVEAMLAE